jgi:hypothetical protein
LAHTFASPCLGREPKARVATEHATIEEICKHFGPCSSKNGWSYDQTINEKKVKLVKEFYFKVTSKAQPPNYEFSLQFAKGVELNWAMFGAHFHEFCSQIQELRKKNKKYICIPCY